MTTRRTREDRREQILDGLFAAMAREGTRGASITDIAENAGIARGALHYYFSSKEEIRQALMTKLGLRYIDALSSYLSRVEAEGREPERLVQALVRYHFGGDAVETERLLSVWIDFWGSAPTDAALNAVVLDVQDRARAQCWRVIAALRPDLRALDADARRARAATLLALIEGGLLQWRIAQTTNAPFPRDTLIKALVDAALALVIGIPAPEVALAAHRGGPDAARE